MFKKNTVLKTTMSSKNNFPNMKTNLGNHCKISEVILLFTNITFKVTIQIVVNKIPEGDILRFHTNLT